MDYVDRKWSEQTLNWSLGTWGGCKSSLGHCTSCIGEETYIGCIITYIGCIIYWHIYYQHILSTSQQLKCQRIFNNGFFWRIVNNNFSRQIYNISQKGFTYKEKIKVKGGACMPPLPHIGSFLRTYLSEEAPSILKI